MRADEKKTRCFLVFYVYTTGFGFGYGEMSMKAEGFPNRNTLIERIKESDSYPDKHDIGVIITNVVELSEEDYESYTADTEKEKE